MKQYELLKMAESLLYIIESNKVDSRDVHHLKMYDEFKRLKSEGHKIGYIAYYLSQQYDCSVATVYRVVKRMEQNII